MKYLLLIILVSAIHSCTIISGSNSKYIEDGSVVFNSKSCNSKYIKNDAMLWLSADNNNEDVRGIMVLIGGVETQEPFEVWIVKSNRVIRAIKDWNFDNLKDCSNGGWVEFGTNETSSRIEWQNIRKE